MQKKATIFLHFFELRILSLEIKLGSRFNNPKTLRAATKLNERR
jgi:hypothetical protein